MLEITIETDAACSSAAEFDRSVARSPILVLLCSRLRLNVEQLGESSLAAFVTLPLREFVEKTGPTGSLLDQILMS